MGSADTYHQHMTGALLSGAPTSIRTHADLRPTASYALIPAAAAVAVLTGALISAAPKAGFALLLVVPVAAVVWWRPVVAAYLVVGVTPLVVGIDRGRILPVLRPNEALVALLVVVLVLRLGALLAHGRTIRFPALHRVEYALLAMAVTSSVIPLAWLTVRGIAPTGDDISYSLVLWKYLVVYGVVRTTVSSDREVRRCLLIIQVTSSFVGVVAILQALDLLGVRHFLAQWYTTLGDVQAIDLARAGSTLSLPAATADLMILTACLTIGMWLREQRHGLWYGFVTCVCVLATFAAGEFSSVLGLVAGAICVAVILRRKDIIGYGSAAVLVGVVVMWPVVATKLQWFQSASGFPGSWIGRWRNLTTYFWPPLSSGTGWNLLLGIRPAARVPVRSQATGFVWIESGYTWLLWGGGFPLVAAFCYFVASSLRLTVRAARALASNVGVAALGAATGVVVDFLLMVFDPHITYRGSADCLLALLAMCAAAAADGRLHPLSVNPGDGEASPPRTPQRETPTVPQRRNLVASANRKGG
jgi:hypothetical protein